MRGSHYESEGVVVFVQNFTDGDSIVPSDRKDATLIKISSHTSLLMNRCWGESFFNEILANEEIQ